ncbi:site-specific integrase [Mycolicibacterium gadium]|uniref:Site-specific integrase n=1 Tax=Mycolicibacterium gadium TaxID=1794 RepID=A0ABT6GSN5_MYCGU|nr:site-specific integrase [Mycolicibacterium gadium]MDG5484627.1 site-specific integrase [Mycolicibacterium gadium]
MATVEAYETKTGRRWRVRYRTPDRRQTDKRGFATKRDARAFAATIEVRKTMGTFVSPTAGRVSVDELATAWLEKKKQSTAPSHYRTLESSWRTHVQPMWATRPVAEMTTIEVEGWITAMARRGHGTTTVRRAHAVLSGILSDAVKAHRLVVNPALGVENLPRRVARRHRYLTASDVHALAVEAGEHRVLVLLLAFCGLRWGEAIALRVGDVEFLRQRILVSTSAVQIGGSHQIGPTKERRSRSVPVPQFVLDELPRRCVDKARDDLVFPGPDGGYLLRPRSSTGWFAAALRRAGLPTITPHDLRHTCASLAVSAGANVLALQRMLGHRSAKVTLDVYADLFDSDLDDVASNLDAAYAPETVGTTWAGSAGISTSFLAKSRLISEDADDIPPSAEVG